MLVADCLSRAQLEEVEESTDLSGVIHSMVENVCLSKENYELYSEKLKQCEGYARILKYVINGWPVYHQLDDLAQCFYKFKGELHFEGGLLFRNHRLVIPVNLQEVICKYEPLMGIEKTLARARMLYYWPGMSKQIRDLVASCTT